MIALWEKYSFEELKQILDESRSKKEFCIKLGYKRRESHALKKIEEKYPDLDFSILNNRKCNDLTGQKFGRLTVLERSENQGRYVRWLCQCECGNKKYLELQI